MKFPMVRTASIVLALCAASPVFGAVIPRDVPDARTINPHWSQYSPRYYTHEPRATIKVNAAAQMQQQQKTQQLNQVIANAQHQLAQVNPGGQKKHGNLDSYAANEKTNIKLWGREDGEVFVREDEDELFAREDDELFTREDEDELIARDDDDDLFAREDDDLFSREDDDLFTREDDEDLFAREDDEELFAREDDEDLFSREDDDDLFARALSKSAEEKSIVDKLENLERPSTPSSVPSSAQGAPRVPANGSHRNSLNNHRTYSEVGRRPSHDFSNLPHRAASEDRHWPANDYHRAKNTATTSPQAKDVPSVKLQGRGLDLATLGAHLLGVKSSTPKPPTQNKNHTAQPLAKQAVPGAPIQGMTGPAPVQSGTPVQPVDPQTQGAGPAATQATGPDATQATGPDATQATGPDATQATGPDATQATGPDATQATGPPATQPTGQQPSDPQAPPQADPLAPAQVPTPEMGLQPPAVAPPVGAPASDPLAPPASGAPPVGAQQPGDLQVPALAPQVGSPPA